jgi:hypothetical protein
MSEIEKFSFSLVSKKRNYEWEKKKLHSLSKTKPVDFFNEHHPLKSNLIDSGPQSKQPKQKTSSFTGVSFIDPLNDPLTNAAASSSLHDQSDSGFSLSKMVADISLKEKQEKLKLNEITSSFEPWSVKKSSILSKYTTLEKLTITSSFLTPIVGQMVRDKIGTSNSSLTSRNITVSDKIKNRMEQLDQFDDDHMQEMSNLSQQEYIKRIDELNNALLSAWSVDDRVKSLKIVIQV